jgi:hypothetical protein
MPFTLHLPDMLSLRAPCLCHAAPQDVGDACLQQLAWWEQHASKLEGAILEQRERAATVEEKLQQLQAQMHSLRQQQEQEEEEEQQQQEQQEQQQHQEQQQQQAQGANSEPCSYGQTAAGALSQNGSPADPEALAAAHQELATLRQQLEQERRAAAEGASAMQECGRLRLQLAAAHLQRQQRDQEWRGLVQAHAAAVQEVKEQVRAQQEHRLAPPQQHPQQPRQQQHADVAECPDYLGLMQQLQEREEELAEAQRGEWQLPGRCLPKQSHGLFSPPTPPAHLPAGMLACPCIPCSSTLLA